MEFITAEGAAEAEFTEKKSRFIGHIAHIASKEDAEEFIEKITKQNRGAAHNVFAYSLRGGQSRYSDNGEPQGTAGLPTSDAITKDGLCDVCIVTTRYFGGILLGAGGLTRAYSHAAALALGAVKRVTMTECTRFKISCDYGFYGKLERFMEGFSHKTISCDFSELVEYRAYVKSEEAQRLIKELIELSNGIITEEHGILNEGGGIIALKP